MKWGIGLGACLALAAVSGLLWPKEVRVIVRDPALQIYEARLWHWQTNVGNVTAVDHPVEQWLSWRCYFLLRKAGMKEPRMSPAVGWITGPNYLPQDVLVLFGNYPEPIGNHMGFDLFNANGQVAGAGLKSGSTSYGRSSRRDQSTTNFGWESCIDTNLHGLFWLKLHGETNVLAEIHIR